MSSITFNINKALDGYPILYHGSPVLDWKFFKTNGGSNE